MKLTLLYLIILSFFISCRHKKVAIKQEAQEPEALKFYPHPKFKHFIEINSVPPPFDVDGMHPYVLWINGKKMNISKVKRRLADIVNSYENGEIQAPPHLDIHQGWMKSHLFTHNSKFHEILLKNARSSSTE